MRFSLIRITPDFVAGKPEIKPQTFETQRKSTRQAKTGLVGDPGRVKGGSAVIAVIARDRKGKTSPLITLIALICAEERNSPQRTRMAQRKNAVWQSESCSAPSGRE